MVEGKLATGEEPVADRNVEKRGEGVNKHVYWVTDELLGDWI